MIDSKLIYISLFVSDLMCIICFGLISPVLISDFFLTFFSIITLITLMDIFGFYVVNQNGRVHFVITMLSTIILYNVVLMAIQFSFATRHAVSPGTIALIDVILMIYLTARHVILNKILYNYAFNVYIIQSDLTADIEAILAKENKKSSSLVYKGVDTASSIRDTVSQTDISNTIILFSNPTDYSDEDQKIIFNLKIHGYNVYTYSNFCEVYLRRLEIDNVSDEWFILSRGFDNIFGKNYVRIKRISDITLSILGLIIASPLLLLAAIAIKTDSHGPVFFSQIRTGIKLKPFHIYKLRTMVKDAEEKGAVWAKTNDARITKVGSFLRKMRIDEIPQLYNVLKGEMSIVGPRPERPEFDTKLAKIIPYFTLRYIVKPGLTGWAQVNYGYGASVEDSKTKLKYDLYYIKNYTFMLDIRIMIKTVYIVIMKMGR